jgi:hypothetical protein
MRIGEEMIANRLQDEYLYGGVVKTIRDSRNDSVWVGIRGKGYSPSLVQGQKGSTLILLQFVILAIANRFTFSLAIRIKRFGIICSEKCLKSNSYGRIDSESLLTC